jgi:hypothetical protein
MKPRQRDASWTATKRASSPEDPDEAVSKGRTLAPRKICKSQIPGAMKKKETGAAHAATLDVTHGSEGTSRPSGAVRTGK